MFSSVPPAFHRLVVLAATMVALMVLPGWIAASAEAPPLITVDTTADTNDAAPTCSATTTGALPGPDKRTTLREAICAANNRPGEDRIVFTVPAGSVIVLTGTLPAIEDDATDVAGDSAPGFVANQAAAPLPSTLRPSVQIDATALGPLTPALTVISGGNRIAGLAMTGKGDGVVLTGRRSVRNRIEAMGLGVTLTASIPPGLGGAGVRVTGAAADLVGGLSPKEANRFVGARAGGVVVDRSPRVKILGNEMDGLGGPGIVISGSIAGETLPMPVLDADSTSTLTLVGSGVPVGGTVDVFRAGPPGDPVYGAVHLGAFVDGGSVDADRQADGRFTFPFGAVGVAAGDRISVTGTDAFGNTSEFSVPVAARTIDSDRDGLPDEEETARNLDPFSADTDGDGVPDAVEACRCSALLLEKSPAAVVEVSSVTGRILRRIALPRAAEPVSGFALGRGPAGSIVAVATGRGVAVVDLTRESVDPKLIPIGPGPVPITPALTGVPAASADGQRVYVPDMTGSIATVSLTERQYLAQVKVGGGPAALAATGSSLAVTYSGARPGLGMFSLADPIRPAPLYDVSALHGAPIPTDTIITSPVALSSSRFAWGIGSPATTPAVVVLSNSSTVPTVWPVVLSGPGSTATIPVAVTAGPGEGQISIALVPPTTDSIGAVATLSMTGTVVTATVTPGRPGGVSVSGTGGLLIPLQGGGVVSVVAPAGSSPPPQSSVQPVTPGGVIGLAAPTTGTDPTIAASGPGVPPAVPEGARLPVIPAPERGGAPIPFPEAPGPVDPAIPGDPPLPVRPVPGGGGAVTVPPASPLPFIDRGAPVGGLPAGGSGGNAGAVAGPPPVRLPQAQLGRASLPAAPGGRFPLPRAVVTTAGKPVGTSPTGVWLLAVGCGAFLVGALAVQPRPGALGPRRIPAPAWMDSPEIAFYGPARRWDGFVGGSTAG